MMKWYPYGHDFGNAEIGGVTFLEQERVARSIPTAFAAVDTQALRGLGIDTSTSFVFRLQTEAISYAIGDLALEQHAEPWTGHGFIGRYASTYSLRGLLAIAASLIPDAEFGVSRDHERQKLVRCDVEEIDLHVGMARPVLREHPRKQRRGDAGGDRDRDAAGLDLDEVAHVA